MDDQIEKYLLNIVKRNYEEIANDFNTTRKKVLWPELIKLTEQIKDNDKILDVGCGNGRLLEAFKNKKIKYIGVDNDEKLINFAKQNYKSENKNQEFLTSNILKLDQLQQTNFDYIFCLAVIHHLPGNNLRLKALKQLKNKLSPQGKIIITVWNLWQQKKFHKILFKSFLLKLIKKNKFDFGDILFDWKNSAGQTISQRYYHAFTKNELIQLFKKAGLKIEKLYKDKYNYYAILNHY